MKRLLKSKFTKPIIGVVLEITLFIISIFTILKVEEIIENKSILISIKLLVCLVNLIFLTYVILSIFKLCDYRKKEKYRKKCLAEIKSKLSSEFVPVVLTTNTIPELTVLLIANSCTCLKAKIDENDEIHLIIENAEGVIYDAKTTNYDWFLNNISF